jgi:hypothetical protein
MTEFLHEVVKKRERKPQSWLPSYLRVSYDELTTRATNAIDLVMRNRDNISVGSTINMPMLDMSSPANAELIPQHVVYTYTGAETGTYRGWVRTN